MLMVMLLAFLVGALTFDVLTQRLPNLYLLLGLIAGLLMQIFSGGGGGLADAGLGLLEGFMLFIPFYVLGGMAAGDVKLMMVVGVLLGSPAALWACACVLVSGAALGIFYIAYKGQFKNLLRRYWAMASLFSYISPEEGDAARQRFPYAIAIFTGTLISLFWQPFGP